LYQRGSHLTLEHPIDGRWTVVPVHGRDIKRGLMKAILEQAGLTQAEFREFL
jgi:mRNA interferase HicA